MLIAVFIDMRPRLQSNKVGLRGPSEGAQFVVCVHDSGHSQLGGMLNHMMPCRQTGGAKVL